MTRPARHRIAWIAGTTVLASQCAARAEDLFKMLNEKQIRARVVGNDISDGLHWSMHLRSDEKLISAESGSTWTGSWKIRDGKLCITLPGNVSLDCHEVWMSGASI